MTVRKRISPGPSGSGRLRPVGDALRLVEHLEDAFAGRGRALRLADPHPEHAERHHEHQHEEVEEEEVGEAQRAVHDHPPADEDHGGLRDEREERQHGNVDRALAVRVHAASEDALGRCGELLLLVRLLRERLDDVDADDVLLGDRRHVGHPLLHVAEHRVRDARVPVGEHHDERGDRAGDERELPVHDEHHRGYGDDRQHVLEEEDEAVAEEEADALQVDGGARHQLPRLMAVVEAEREPEELRVHLVAEVELDAERLAARDQAAAGHEERPSDADGQNRHDEHPEVAAVLRLDHVRERVARQVGGDDRGGLAPDGEDDRDGKRPLVRLEEAEQAEERRAVSRATGHPIPI